MRLLTLALAAFALSACTTTATVVSSANNGPTVAQAQAEPYNGVKQRIAIEPFEYRAADKGAGVGAGMADMLTDSLFNTNKFIVVERDRLGAITAEQDLGATGRFKQDTVAPIGQLEGARLDVLRDRGGSDGGGGNGGRDGDQQGAAGESLHESLLWEKRVK